MKKHVTQETCGELLPHTVTDPPVQSADQTEEDALHPIYARMRERMHRMETYRTPPTGAHPRSQNEGVRE